MSAPILSGRRALVRTAILALALEAVVEVRRGEEREPDPAPSAPSNERKAS